MGCFLLIRLGKVHPTQLRGLLLAGLVVCLVGYSSVSFWHEATSGIRSAKLFHSFLHIKPPELPPVDEGKKTVWIVCLGGSTTAWGDSNGRAWPSRIEAALNDRFEGSRIRVLNQGRQWYTTLHSLINYESRLRHLKPDVLVVMHAINDLMVNADHSYYVGGPFRDDYGHYYGPLARLARTRPLVQRFLETMKASWYWTPREIIDTDRFPGLLPFERNLTRLIELARFDGAEVVLLTQGSLYKKKMTAEEKGRIWMQRENRVGPHKKWSIQTARRGMERYNERTREIARTTKAPLVDLEVVLAKTLDYFLDDAHYRDRAFDVIASAVTQRLEELLSTDAVSLGLTPVTDSHRPEQVRH